MKDDVPPQESCDNVLQYLESLGSDLGLGKLLKIIWKGKNQGKLFVRVWGFLHFFTGYLDFLKIS